VLLGYSRASASGAAVAEANGEESRGGGGVPMAPFLRRRKQLRLGVGTESIRASLGRRTWSRGGGRSADSADARWRAVTEPPRHACMRACAHGGWTRSHGPSWTAGTWALPTQTLLKLSQPLKFKMKVFPMSKNTQIL
jgi:hypothetical protein